METEGKVRGWIVCSMKDTYSGPFRHPLPFFYVRNLYNPGISPRSNGRPFSQLEMSMACAALSRASPADLAIAEA
jgi:hypothetical protein